MGRGRAKAKQTKLAREVKYRSPAADFDALRRELSGEPVNSSSTDDRYDDDEDDGYDNDRR
jgi:DUF3073 family protein